LKKKKDPVGVGNKEMKGKRGEESNGIKGIRKSLKCPWRAHLHSYTQNLGNHPRVTKGKKFVFYLFTK